MARNEYLVWDNTNTSNGDILGVYESLGNRTPNSVTITSSGSDTHIKLNVAEKIYQSHAEVSGVQGLRANASFFGPDAAFHTSPYRIDEIDNSDTTPTLTIYAGETHIYSSTEVGIMDIKIETLAPLTRIIVT